MKKMTRIFESTVKELSKFIEYTLTNQEFINKKGLLQSIDPRIKLITTIAVIFMAIQTAEIKIFTLLFLLAIVLSVLSRIRLRFFLKRVFIFTPLFSALVVLPYPFVFGTQVAQVVNLYLITFPIYYEGLIKAFIFVFRVTITISFATLFILTTQWNNFLLGLKKLHVPSIFVVLLNTTYRQITQFVNLLYKILTTRESRMVHSLGSLEGIKYWSGAVGLLFIKAYEYAEKSTLAINARGGSIREVVSLYDVKIKILDIVFLVCFGALIMVIMYYFNNAFTTGTYIVELVKKWLATIL